jgi:predicted permease
MLHLLATLLFVYLFISLGYLAKRLFKEEFDTKTITLLSVYILQPFLTMWGFSTATLAWEHLYVVVFYLVVILLLLIPTLAIAKALFRDPKDRAIFSIAGFVGNTGNIGIPLGLALFGEASLIYTTLINIANVFVVYILGVYLYSRGSFSIVDSLKNIIKIPIIPVALIAMLFNIYAITLPYQIQEFLKMGAYAGMVMQLILLGSFLYNIKLSTLNRKLLLGTLSQKFLLIPLATAALLSFTEFSLLIKAIIFMEMLVPLAVANINLASLYDCKPKVVTSLILISTLLFLPLLMAMSLLLESHPITAL